MTLRHRVWRAMRVTALGVRDAADLVTGRRRPMTPSRLQNESIGGFDFHAIGRELVTVVRALSDLGPHERVLDAGCGYGRVAVPLTSYLTTGQYRGFDIDKAAIRWCTREIARRHPNFSFAHVDVANSYYNPRGRVAPESFVFPCADASMDVVVATSLFTHLLPAAAAQYVAETSRVLKPGGRAVLSFFLFSRDVDLGDPRVKPAFRHFPEPHYAVSHPEEPELGVAYDEDVVRRAFRDRGLRVERIEHGAWRLQPNAMSFQDFVLATKSGE